MSHYDVCAREHTRLVAIGLVFYLLVLVPLSWWIQTYLWSSWLVVPLVAALAVPIHLSLRLAWETYRVRHDRLRALAQTKRAIQMRVQAIYAAVPPREKHQHFKSAYDLKGKTVADFERHMAIGMHHEIDEVYVTAFVREDTVVRVTASIGSAFRCRPADDPGRWREHAIRLRCTEIRQYHNHPTRSNRTSPSRPDIASAGSLRQLLGDQSQLLRNYIVYWNQIREWRILQYDEHGKFSLSHELDADVACVRPANGLT
jgi:hypothetical protein